MKIWTELSSILSQWTHLTDRRTDGRTPFSSLIRARIPCSAEKHIDHSVEREEIEKKAARHHTGIKH